MNEYKLTLSKMWLHFKKICMHKWWVFYYCCKLGIVWRGIKHDLSKFSPTEFFESSRYYVGTSSPIDLCKKVKGYSKAWQHHKGRNKHHYEHWTDNYDSGTTFICMPFLDTLEMMCDYLGAGKAYNGKEFTYKKELDWWNKKLKNGTKMNEVQRNFISEMFIYMWTYNKLPTKSKCRQSYDKYVDRFNAGEKTITCKVGGAEYECKTCKRVL